MEGRSSCANMVRPQAGLVPVRELDVTLQGACPGSFRERTGIRDRDQLGRVQRVPASRSEQIADRLFVGRPVTLRRVFRLYDGCGIRPVAMAQNGAGASIAGVRCSAGARSADSGGLQG